MFILGVAVENRFSMSDDQCVLSPLFSQVRGDLELWRGEAFLGLKVPP